MVPIGGLRIKIKFLMTFGKKFFYIWNNVYKMCQLKTESDIFNTPLWFNSKLENSNLFKKHWNSNGILVIGHIVKSDFQILKKRNWRANIIFVSIIF